MWIFGTAMTGKLYIPDLRASAANRPAGYLDEILAAGRIENDVVLHIDLDVYRALVKKYSPNRQMPSVATQAKNLIGAASKAILNPKAVSKEERERRLAICNACEFLVDGKRCAKCGCTVNWKSRLEAWHCPIEKW